MRAVDVSVLDPEERPFDNPMRIIACRGIRPSQTIANRRAKDLVDDKPTDGGWNVASRTSQRLSGFQNATYAGRDVRSP